MSKYNPAGPVGLFETRTGIDISVLIPRPIPTWAAERIAMKVAQRLLGRQWHTLNPLEKHEILAQALAQVEVDTEVTKFAKPFQKLSSGIRRGVAADVRAGGELLAGWLVD